MNLIGSPPNRAICEMSPKSNVIRECTKIWQVMRDEVCTKLDFEQLFLPRLDWRPVTEQSQLNA